MKKGGKPSHSSPYNPLQTLNNLQNGTVYKLVSRTGSAHNPVFTIKVVANGQTFTGQGASKKIARYQAASAALKTYKNSTPVKASKKIVASQKRPPSRDSLNEIKELKLDSIRRKKGKTSQSSPVNPLQTLNNLQNGTVYELVSRTGSPHNPVFTMKVVANGQTFTGQGASKKIARYEAASAALKTYKNTTPVKTGKKIVASPKSPPSRDLLNEIKELKWDSTRREISKVKLKNGNTVNVQPKNPLAMLNELHMKVQYDLVSKTGESHKPVFTVRIVIFGGTYQGQGSSIRIARIKAAVAALESLINNENMLTDLLVERCAAKQKNDLIAAIKFSLNTVHFGMPVESTTSTSKPKLNQCPVDPVSLLYKIFPNSYFECKVTNELQPITFRMIVRVNGTPYEGRGQSKKSAKLAAAKTALAALCHLSFSSPVVENKMTNGLELPQAFADKVGQLIVEKYKQLSQGDSENQSRRKVFAGFVMTRNAEYQNPEIICVTTGNRCINGEYMSRFGAVLNDSHAEVLSRRCLIDYLYSQLTMLGSNRLAAEHSIFEKPSQPDQLYTLKKGIQFHLYISISPCGDARVFGPHERNLNLSLIEQRDNKHKGLLRTKVEAGEGTIPVTSGSGIQTWDGILAGEKLLTMSCSDKVCRWNVVGIQGALLSNIIEPIYIHSLVLGSVFDPVHVYRGICGRIEDAIQNLPSGFRVNKPKLALISSVEERNMSKTANLSNNWTIGEETFETVDMKTGITVEQQSSRICKQAFFNRYAQLLKTIGNVKGEKLGTTYGESKNLAVHFQAAKRELFDAFRNQQLGSWLQKPIEQNQFELG